MARIKRFRQPQDQAAAQQKAEAVIITHAQSLQPIQQADVAVVYQEQEIRRYYENIKNI
jgi:hypothetical protein